jgi:hypothetical protein
MIMQIYLSDSLTTWWCIYFVEAILRSCKEAKVRFDCLNNFMFYILILCVKDLRFYPWSSPNKHSRFLIGNIIIFPADMAIWASSQNLHNAGFGTPLSWSFPNKKMTIFTEEAILRSCKEAKVRFDCLNNFMFYILILCVKDLRFYPWSSKTKNYQIVISYISGM